MKVRLRQRAMRAIFAAVASPEFSDDEVREIANAMRLGDISIDVAMMLEDFSRHLRAVDRHDPGLRETDQRFMTAKDLMASGKVTKTALSKMIARVLSSATPPSTKISADEMLLSFLGKATDWQAEKLFSLLRDSSDGDAYLAGIMKRQER